MQCATICFTIGFMEWIFFYTKPSFMDSFATADIIPLIIIPSFWLFICSSFLTGILLYLPAPKFLKAILPLAVPTFLLASLLLISFDNFVYTVFSWAISGSEGIRRIVYSFLFIIFLFLTGQYLFQKAKIINKNAPPLPILLTLGGTLLALVLSFVMIFNDWNTYQIEITVNPEKPHRRPNIIFFAGDGIEARFSSAYGYQINSTPALNEIAKTSLLFKNAFSPSSKSTGATTSLLTGIHPFRTKVLFPPHILSGQNSFQHFPAILRKLGYVGYQAGVRFYVDSADLNMQQSFDISNGRSLWNPDPSSVIGNLAIIFNDEIYFSKRVFDRFSSRIQHVLGIQNMSNYFVMVSQAVGLDWDRDRLAVDEFIDFTKNTKSPYFAHIHLMGTHCCEYRNAKSKLLSEIQSPITQAVKDKNTERRYVNTIRDSDDHLSYLLGKLSEQGKLNNTILVLSSDHSRVWSSLQRVPLVITFPNNEHMGVKDNNVQLTDVASTILKYMRIERPTWIDGQELQSTTEHRISPLVTVESADIQKFYKFPPKVRLNNPGSPRYGIGDVGVIVCNISKRISLDTGHITNAEIIGHTQPCSREEMPDDPSITAHLKKLLDENNFDTPFQHK